MKMPDPISTFTKLLSRECEEATVSIDAPKEADGEYWVDVKAGKFHTSLAWKSKVGFGVYMSDPEGYGERPDELYARPQDACARICQLVASARNEGAHGAMKLRELRHIVGTSQVDLAAQLEVNQAAISRMENRDDMHLSSLHDYVAAMGGELEIRAKFEGFEARIEPVPLSKAKARG